MKVSSIHGLTSLDGVSLGLLDNLLLSLGLVNLFGEVSLLLPLNTEDFRELSLSGHGSLRGVFIGGIGLRFVLSFSTEGTVESDGGGSGNKGESGELHL